VIATYPGKPGLALICESTVIAPVAACVYIIQMALRYRIRELSTVTDETIERTINEEVEKGWSFEGMQFAMRDASKRPAMVFVLFTREAGENEEDVSPTS